MGNKRHRSMRDVPNERGPNGRRLCAYCRVEVKPPRQSFCSDACVHEHKIRSDAGYAARLVFDRDLGICSRCGIDTVKRLQDARVELRDAPQRVRTNETAEEWARCWDSGRKAVVAAWKAAGWPTTLSRRWWEMEHVIPVVEGGGDCGLDNLITLCVPCHKKSTKELAGRRAQARKLAKESKDANPTTAPDAGDMPGSRA